MLARESETDIRSCVNQPHSRKCFTRDIPTQRVAAGRRTSQSPRHRIKRSSRKSKRPQRGSKSMLDQDGIGFIVRSTESVELSASECPTKRYIEILHRKFHSTRSLPVKYMLKTSDVRSAAEKLLFYRLQTSPESFPLMSAEGRSHLVGNALLGTESPPGPTAKPPARQIVLSPTAGSYMHGGPEAGDAVLSSTSPSRKTAAEDACQNPVQKRRCLNSMHLEGPESHDGSEQTFELDAANEDRIDRAVLSTPKVTHSGTSLTSSHINSATTRTVQPEIPCFDNEATACSKDYTSSKNTRPVRDVTGTGTAGTGVSDNDGTATDATVTITAAIDVIAAAVTAPDATVTNTKVMDVTITDATVTNTAATDIPGTDATDTNSTTIDVTGTDVTVTDATVTNTTAIDVTGTTASPDVVVTDDREATTDDDTASDDAPSDGVMAGTSTVRSETTSTSNFCSGTTGLTTLQSMERPTPMCSTVLKKETVEEDQGSAPISLQRDTTRDEEAALAMFALHRHAYGFPTTSTHRSPPKGVFTSETNAGSAVPTVSGGGTADEHARFGAPREDVAGDDTSSHHSNSTVADDGTQTGARSDEDADDVTDDDGDHSHVIKQTSAPKPRKRSVRPVPVHRSPHNTMQKFPTGAHPQLQSGSIANVPAYQLVRPGMPPTYVQHPPQAMNMMAMPHPGAIYVPSSHGHVLPHAVQYMNQMQQHVQQMQFMTPSMHHIQFAHDLVASQRHPQEYWNNPSTTHVVSAGTDLRHASTHVPMHRGSGRHGTHEKACICCRTTTTPLWRDIPQDGACPGQPLCNACGIRYTKYGLLCVNCFYVPNKQQRQHTQCPRCSEPLPPPRKKPTPSQSKSAPPPTSAMQ